MNLERFDYFVADYLDALFERTHNWNLVDRGAEGMLEQVENQICYHQLMKNHPAKNKREEEKKTMHPLPKENYTFFPAYITNFYF